VRAAPRGGRFRMIGRSCVILWMQFSPSDCGRFAPCRRSRRVLVASALIPVTPSPVWLVKTAILTVKRGRNRRRGGLRRGSGSRDAISAEGVFHDKSGVI